MLLFYADPFIWFLLVTVLCAVADNAVTLLHPQYRSVQLTTMSLPASMRALRKRLPEPGYSLEREPVPSPQGDEVLLEVGQL